MKLQKVFIVMEHDAIFGVFATRRVALQAMKGYGHLTLFEEEIQKNWDVDE